MEMYNYNQEMPVYSHFIRDAARRPFLSGVDVVASIEELRCGRDVMGVGLVSSMLTLMSTSRQSLTTYWCLGGKSLSARRLSQSPEEAAMGLLWTTVLMCRREFSDTESAIVAPRGSDGGGGGVTVDNCVLFRAIFEVDTSSSDELSSIEKYLEFGL